MAQLKGFFKKITGDTVSYDALAKQPIIDAEVKLNIFKETTGISIAAFETYIKYMTKSIDLQLSEKFLECKELFKKYESKGEFLNPNISHVLGIVFGKLHEIQLEMHNDVNELSENIQHNVLKPLNDYQKEIGIVKENRKELKDAYDKIEEYRNSLHKARKEADNAQKSTTQSSRLHINNDINKKMNDINKLEDKVQRIERELDEANSLANEKYDKYTEGLYKRIAEECELTRYYLDYLRLQKKYHKQALKRLDTLIPNVRDLLNSYNKKPVFGSSLNEYVNISNSNMHTSSNSNRVVQNNNNSNEFQLVSPVIRKLIDGMCKQNVFSEEGIFRVAGSRIKMNCILNAINSGYLDYLDTANDFDVHCLAGVLKQYIRELPDSLLCNDMYDDWVVAINTLPAQNKIEAFKIVLNKLPRTNYENLRYLIKFFAKIVENSDRTKMTSTNMGICFGVNLITNTTNVNNMNLNTATNSATQFPTLNGGSQTENSIASSSSSKLIDMSTATNVFDFLLTNCNDLFPGDINFLMSNSNTMKSIGTIYHSSSNSTLYGSKNQLHQSAKSPESSNMNNSQIDANISNRHYVLNDSLNDHAPSIITSMPNQFNVPQIKSNNNTSLTHSPSNLSQYNNINRHIKHNSMENRSILGLDTNSDYVNNFVKTNHLSSNQQSQSNSYSNHHNDSGSASPKLKNKKQAPAPPPTSNVILAANSNNSHPFPTNLNEQTNAENGGFNNNFGQAQSNFSNSLSARLSSSSNLKTPSFNELSTSIQQPSNSILEKPNQPPPNIPNRPPPIGFNVNSIDSSQSQTAPPSPPKSNTSINGAGVDSPTPPYPVLNTFKTNNSIIGFSPNSDNVTNSVLLTSSITSTSSSSSQDQQQQVTQPSPNNTLSRQNIKPVVPRKPGGGGGGLVAAHINKFQSMNLSDLNDSTNDNSQNESSSTNNNKSTNEITSL